MTWVLFLVAAAGIALGTAAVLVVEHYPNTRIGRKWPKSFWLDPSYYVLNLYEGRDINASLRYKAPRWLWSWMFSGVRFLPLVAGLCFVAIIVLWLFGIQATSGPMTTALMASFVGTFYTLR